MELELKEFVFHGRFFINFPEGMSIEEHYEEG